MARGGGGGGEKNDANSMRSFERDKATKSLTNSSLAKKKSKKMGLQCNNNNSELYLHDYYNTSLQKRRKHDNYSDSVIKVQLQH